MFTPAPGEAHTEQNEAGMVCLPKISAGDQALITKVKNADGKLVVLDGCPLNCAKKILNNAGISDLLHLVITDFDIKKSVTPITTETIDKLIARIKEQIAEKWKS